MRSTGWDEPAVSILIFFIRNSLATSAHNQLLLSDRIIYRPLLFLVNYCGQSKFIIYNRSCLWTWFILFYWRQYWKSILLY